MRKQRTWIAAGLVAAAALLSGSAAQAQWGTLKGQVTLNGTAPAMKLLVKKGDTSVKDSSVCSLEDVPDESLVIDPDTKGVANVVVWIAKKPAKIHPDLTKSKEVEVVFDQKNCRFLPHVLLVRTDQKVRVISDDGVAHNTHTYPIKNKQENFIVAPNDRKGVLVSSVNLAERLPAKVGCDIHPWMQAYWVILDHPYVAVTNAKGEFEIPNLPVGEHKFVVWQEKSGYLNRDLTVNIKAGENTVPIKANAADFAK